MKKIKKVKYWFSDGTTKTVITLKNDLFKIVETSKKEKKNVRKK